MPRRAHGESLGDPGSEPARRGFLRVAGAAGLSTVLASLPNRAAGEPAPEGEGVYDLGDFALQSGATLREAKLAYKTHGHPEGDGSNVIVYTTPFANQHMDVEWLIGPGKALDPQKYFIVVPDMLGNGLSSSPSNTPPPHDRARFPNVSVLDNVLAQHRLVREGFGVDRVALVVGFSMGAEQTFQWGVSFPGMVARIAPFGGTARTTPHNWVFLESLKAALTADAAWMDGEYEKQPLKGMRAFARVYSGWGFSQRFYKRELWRRLDYSSLEDFLVGFWERRYMRRDANNLLAMLWTWQHNDVGATPGFGSSLSKALGSIRAPALVMAGETDLYFPPEDIEENASHIPNARFEVIPSVWGHMAGSGLNPEDTQFIDDRLKAFLTE